MQPLLLLLLPRLSALPGLDNLTNTNVTFPPALSAESSGRDVQKMVLSAIAGALLALALTGRGREYERMAAADPLSATLDHARQVLDRAPARHPGTDAREAMLGHGGPAPNGRMTNLLCP